MRFDLPRITTSDLEAGVGGGTVRATSIFLLIGRYFHYHRLTGTDDAALVEQVRPMFTADVRRQRASRIKGFWR